MTIFQNINAPQEAENLDYSQFISEVQSSQIRRIEGVTTTVNYGLDKVRFIAPVPVDSKVRARQKLEAVEPRGENRYMLHNTVTIEIEGSEKPACIAQSLSLIIF